LLSIGLNRLNPTFDFAHGLEVVTDFHSVFGSEPCLQPRHVGGHGVEDAAILRCALEALSSRSAIAEQALEDRAWIVLRRQRRRRRTPRQRVHVDAAVPVAAVADEESEST